MKRRSYSIHDKELNLTMTFVMDRTTYLPKSHKIVA